MSQQPKFITLMTLLSNSVDKYYIDGNTGKKKRNKDYRDIPISVLATAIEKNNLLVIDDFNRKVLATDGEVDDPLSIKCALDAVKFYDDANKHGIPTDIYFEDEHCPLYRFGWPEDALPNFEEINPHHANPKAVSNITLITDKKAKGLTKQLVMNAFEGLHFNRDQWSNYLASPPQWLIPCRVARGNKKVSATWNPVLIGLALMDKKISIKQLDLVFMRLKDLKNEWQEKTDLMR